MQEAVDFGRICLLCGPEQADHVATHELGKPDFFFFFFWTTPFRDLFIDTLNPHCSHKTNIARILIVSAEEFTQGMQGSDLAIFGRIQKCRIIAIWGTRSLMPTAMLNLPLLAKAHWKGCPGVGRHKPPRSRRPAPTCSVTSQAAPFRRFNCFCAHGSERSITLFLFSVTHRNLRRIAKRM